jgi:hypothetical protein
MLPLFESTCVNALVDNNNKEIFVIRAANSVNCDKGLYRIIEACIENSIDSSIRDIIESGSEIKGIRDCMAEESFDII